MGGIAGTGLITKLLDSTIILGYAERTWMVDVAVTPKINQRPAITPVCMLAPHGTRISSERPLAKKFTLQTDSNEDFT